MTNYEELAKHVSQSMQDHPQDMVVMDSSSFEVIAIGKDFKQMGQKIRCLQSSNGIPIVFRRPDENAA